MDKHKKQGKLSSDWEQVSRDQLSVRSICLYFDAKETWKIKNQASKFTGMK